MSSCLTQLDVGPVHVRIGLRTILMIVLFSELSIVLRIDLINALANLLAHVLMTGQA